ncbi:glucoamylase family protein [Tessaracoccus coleopterorum]|uniref:glucoamylase family protein n=1 Tax=Tessaracoccus coleopterorum TaxID=2714950 RepID=UPI0018D4002D|nr:glucoamylase family protein [Tessaracoccus coleopterorum]
MHRPDPSQFSRRTALTGGLTVAAFTALPPLASADAGPTPAGGRGATLMRWARDTWASMVAMTDPVTGLISDNITGDLGNRAHYTSPTNIGGYLWSTIVARDLRIITPGEANIRIRRTLRTLRGMQHHDAAGMYFNWYDPRDGSAILEWPDDGNPVVPFVSSVDAAWLGAALLVVRNGDPGNSKAAGELFSRMRFDVFADPTFSKPYLNYGGYYLEEPTRLTSPPPTIARDLIGEGSDVWYTRDHHYDTVVSETRITTYLGIAKGQIPPESYYQAWRTFPPDWDWQESIPVGEWHTYLGVDVYEGHTTIWGARPFPVGVARCSRSSCPTCSCLRRRGRLAPGPQPSTPRGRAEAARHAGVRILGLLPASHPAGGYSEWGVDALGLNPDGYFSDIERTNYSARTNPAPDFGNGVVTPHAAFLAMLHDPAEAYANLTRIEHDFDSYGAGGFYDAVATATGQVAKRHLSLDQAMILGALGNVLAGGNLRRYFTRGEVERRVRPVIAPEIFAPLGGE